MITTKVEEHTLIISINRPKALNAINAEVMKSLGRLFIDEAEEIKKHRSIIITGVGEKAFAAGADISEFPSFGKNEGTALSAYGHKVYDAIETFSRPVIAAINGYALGGGCELAMACHLRIAEEQVKLGQPEINLGLIPGYGGTFRFIRYLGRGRAIEYLLSGDMISAQEALEFGLINRIVGTGKSMEESLALAKKINQKSSTVIDKLLTLVHSYHAMEPSFAGESKAFGECFSLPDMKEGVQAFLQKRKPNFNQQA